jgi:hypothetical protein
MGWLPRCLPHHQRWVAVPQSGLTAWYVHRETQTITYPSKGGTRHVQALRKALVEVPNLSKGEMCSNYSLSICPKISATIHRPTQGAGFTAAALPDLLLRHLPGARRRSFYVDGGCSRTSSSGTSRGPTVDVLTLMVGAPRPSASSPPRGPSSTAE